MFTAQERLESIKTALVASLPAMAMMASWELVWHRWQSLPLQLAIAALSAALFGLTYRYTVRQSSNSHLKGGVVLAFSGVRGLAFLGQEPLTVTAWIPLVQSLLLFGLTALVLEWLIGQGIVKPGSHDY